MAIVYGLQDKHTGKCFYVGSTKKEPDKRLAEHRSNVVYGYNKNRHFVNKVVNMGFDNIEIVVIEEVSDEDRFDREKYWIEKYTADGIRLVNLVHNGFIPIYNMSKNTGVSEEDIAWAKEWYEQYSLGYELEAIDPSKQGLASMAQKKLYEMMSDDPDWLKGITS